MPDLTIFPVSASHMAVTTDDEGVREDLYQYFRFEDPTFTPNKFSRWDGQVRLYEKKTGKMAYGLLSSVLNFAKDRQLSLDIDPAFKEDIKPVTREDIQTWCDEMDIRDDGNRIHPYDYQVEGLFLAVKYSRVTLLAATSAGKSLLQYLIIRFLQQINPQGRILLVVPSINLVTQMKSDFANYSSANGWDTEANVHQIFEGRTPYTRKPVVISTWQSLKDLEPSYFHQFTTLLGDECHTFGAKCLETIGFNCINAYNRIGLTGTLKKDKLHPLQVQQHFGPIRRIVTTKQLQDAGRAAKTKVTVFQVEHTTEDRQVSRTYQEEIDFLLQHNYRNKLIKSLAKTLKGNTLMLFDRVEKHLEVIAEELRQEAPNKTILVITGNVENDERQIIKATLEKGDNLVLLASFGTMSTGVSIKKLHNLVFCHPSKSIIRVLQSLGRLLRLHESKDVANIYDIVDVMMYMGKLNHAMRHGAERLGFYRDEQHPVEVKKLTVPSK